MNAIFHDKLPDCLEDYVNDIVIKSREVCYDVDDLVKVIIRCMQYNFRMNPFKRAFDVSSGKFLGFISIKEGSTLILLKLRLFKI